MDSHTPTCNGNLSAQEFGFLQNLYNATNGSFWTWDGLLANSTEWRFPSCLSTPCTDRWQGLLCSNQTQLGSECTIISLLLPDMNLSGSIPTSIVFLSNLKNLALPYNDIGGSIPSELAQLSYLQLVVLNNNVLTGSVPPGLGGLESVTEIFLDTNLIVGSIPTEFANMPSLKTLHLNTNLLTGTIPNELAKNPNLSRLYLYSNMLTGTVPPEFGVLQNLEQLGLNNNLLTGSIPTELGALQNLDGLYVYSNLLTGSIPDQLGGLQSLQQLYLEINELTGTIPTQLGNLSNLVILYANGNMLSGSIPSELGNVQYLGQVYLFANLLIGPIPASFGDLKALSELVLNDNGLTGTIPNELFGESLTVIELFNNCFGGSIPDSICNAVNLSTAVLDNLSSGSFCSQHAQYAFKKILHGSFPEQLIEGSIPSCVWSMPKLQNLHASGNGLRGTLGDIPATSTLRVLDVSSNYIVGTVPLTLQSHSSFQQLSLASNKLQGTLSSSFAVGSGMTLLSLSVNRFSSSLPESLYSTNPALSLDVLTGNLFSCSNSYLPPLDPARGSYVCGSTNLDDALYIWLSMAGLLGAALLGSYSVIHWLSSSHNINNNIPSPTGLSLMRSFWASYSFSSAAQSRWSRAMAANELFGKVILLLTLMFTFVCMPSYALMKYSGTASMGTNWSTVTEQYAWVTTAGFLQGLLPAGLIVAYIFLTECGLMLAVGRAFKKSDYSTLNRTYMKITDIQVDKSPHSWVAATSIRFLLQAINIVVIVAVNSAYVYAILVGQLSQTGLIFVQVLLSLFKLLWKLFYISWAVRWIRESSSMNSRSAQYHELLLSLCNFVVSPCIATLGTDSNCFYYAFVGYKSVTSTFDIVQYDSVCVLSECDEVGYPVSTSITTTPPWLYSYQCTSALITNYTPVLILLYVNSGVVIPMMQCSVLWLPARLRRYLAPLLLLFNDTVYS